jgi:hypothetical protein
LEAEWLNEEIKRRTRVVRIFPNTGARELRHMSLHGYCQSAGSPHLLVKRCQRC